MGRPEILFPLFAELTSLDGIGPKTAKSMAGLRIGTPRDLLFTLPHSGIDRARKASIRDVTAPATVTVEVEIDRHLPARGRGPARVEVSDARTSFQIVFFHARGDWLAKQLPVGERLVVSGKVELFDGVAQMVHPDHIVAKDRLDTIPEFEPLYPLAAGVTNRTMQRAVADLCDRLPDLAEWTDPNLRTRENWPSWRAALRSVHAPERPTDLSSDSAARQRLAYDELLAHQFTLALARANRLARRGIVSRGDERLRARTLAALAFAPTGAQLRATDEIARDMASDRRMNRLLQGDVGSGKTLVAFLALLIAVEAGGQGALMAPTEILARQHLEALQPLAKEVGVVLEILTGRDKGRERADKLAALARGDIQILVGTHAVFQQDVAFQDLRLAIVDEQHRFGVRQRLELAHKGAAADVLVMTATPIPRSLSLAQYGDMDVSVLDEKPPGRKPVQTALVSTDRTDAVIDRLRAAIAAGRQAYWVCPLVVESEVSDLVAAEDRFAKLRAALGDDNVGLVHGQMPPDEKDAAMARFVSGKTSVLVATTVIEVGVNVPNASIMVIERADSFGLSQLHQLRGRVGRGDAASTCLLIYQAPLNETARRRLEILRETEDGFRIAEDDLALRGAGDVIGHAQSGLPRFRIADLERQAGLMQLAQDDARTCLATDPTLTSERGQAVRTLLWLMEQDKAIRLISIG